MKNLILTFSFILIPFIIFSQGQGDFSSSVMKYKLDHEITQVWDESSGQMVNDYKSEYTYDSSGNLTQFIISTWEQGVWNMESKTEFNFDKNGLLVESSVYTYIQGQIYWLNYGHEYTYDTNGNLTQDLYGFDWFSYWKNDYNYDSNNKLIQKITYNNDESNWNESSKIEYAYDINGNLEQEIHFGWSGLWEETEKIEYHYNNDGKLMDYVNSSWYGTQWMPTGKTEFYYNTDDNVIYYINYWHDGFINVWAPLTKVDFEYNDSYSYGDLVLPYFYNHTEFQIGYIHQQIHEGIGTIFDLGTMFFNHMMTTRTAYHWDGTLNDWVLENVYAFYFTEQEVLSTPEMDLEQIKLYPNPTSGVLNILLSQDLKLQSVKLYNVLGQLVKVSHTTRMDLSNLSKGPYYIQLETNKGKADRKVIIQ